MSWGKKDVHYFKGIPYPGSLRLKCEEVTGRHTIVEKGSACISNTTKKICLINTSAAASSLPQPNHWVVFPLRNDIFLRRKSLCHMAGLIDAAMLSGSLKPCWHKIIVIYEAKPSDSSQTMLFRGSRDTSLRDIAFPSHWLRNSIGEWFEPNLPLHTPLSLAMLRCNGFDLLSAAR